MCTTTAVRYSSLERLCFSFFSAEMCMLSMNVWETHSLFSVHVLLQHWRADYRICSGSGCLTASEKSASISHAMPQIHRETRTYIYSTSITIFLSSIFGLLLVLPLPSSLLLMLLSLLFSHTMPVSVAVFLLHSMLFPECRVEINTRGIWKVGS